MYAFTFDICINYYLQPYLLTFCYKTPAYTHLLHLLCIDFAQLCFLCVLGGVARCKLISVKNFIN